MSVHSPIGRRWRSGDLFGSGCEGPAAGQRFRSPGSTLSIKIVGRVEFNFSKHANLNNRFSTINVENPASSHIQKSIKILKQNTFTNSFIRN